MLLGKALISFGIILIVLGLILSFVGKIPWLGRLPGDIYIHKKNFSFYFPITTSILLSILLTIIFSFFGKR
ncbi:MAG: hypothetical protein AMJ78_04705 [Omnitrophica WOR_2 bacterium SM23_29]|nr:MAG: hypothetical protein AMJ78_04705 [Omnitrophica WOR_2 bacterium SM23_29]